MRLKTIMEAMVSPIQASGEGLGLIDTIPENNLSSEIVLFDFHLAMRLIDGLVSEQGLKKALFDACVGGIFVHYNTPATDEKGVEYQYSQVVTSYAEKGYGPLMYYTAGYLSSQRGDGGFIGSDEDVKPAALAVWNFFYEREKSFARKRRLPTPPRHKRDPEIHFVYKVDKKNARAKELFDEGEIGMLELLEYIKDFKGFNLGSKSLVEMIRAQTENKFLDYYRKSK